MIQPRIKFKSEVEKPNDSYNSVINNTPIVTHFYYLHNDMLGHEGKNFKPFSQSGLVLNFLYMPFLSPNDMDVYKIPYDQKNLGTVADTGSAFEPDVNVYKLWQGFIKDKDLGTFSKFPSFNRQLGKKHWSNESKIWQYPYHYLTVNDYINTPLMLIPQYLKQLTNHVYVSQPITITGGYTLYVPNYKGDKKGVNEGLFSSSGLDLPTSSTQYSQFMANSKNTFLAEQSIIQKNYSTGIATSTIGSISGNAGALTTSAMSSSNTLTTAAGTALSGAGAGAMLGSIAGPVGTAVGAGIGLVGGMVTGYLSNKNTKENAILSSQAKLNDIISAPRNVSLSSSDILMTMDRNEKKLWVNRYTITDYYKEKLCDYWTLYGYKQNKLMYEERNGLIKTRRHFNYIKTINANIIGENIDKTEIELIRQIYNSGITFWHQREMEQDGVKMYDYSKDNYEFDR